MYHNSNNEDIYISNNGLTLMTDLAEDHVILGSTGLSRGIHYWEFRIDRMDPGAQPAFGVARSDCKKDEMLGILNFYK